MKRIFTSFLFLTMAFSSIAQLNDDCQTATPLQVGTPLLVENSSIAAATQSQEGLMGVFGSSEDDLWYSFEATSSVMTVFVVGSESFDAVIQVYKGACGTLEFVNYGDFSVEGEQDDITLNGLAVGQTYYARVYDYAANSTEMESNAYIVGVLAGDPCENEDDPFTVSYSWIEGELTPVFTGGTAPYTYFIDVFDENIEDWVEYDNQPISNVEEGTLNFVYGFDAAGCSRFLLVIPGYTALETVKLDAANTMQVYPNPAIDKLQVTFSNTISSDLTVEMISVTGQVLSTEVVKGNDLTNFTFTVSNLPAGVYTLKATSVAGVSTQRVVISK